MAWYWWVLIIVSVIIFIAVKVQIEKHKTFLADISTWKVGDRLRTRKHYMDIAEKNGQEYPQLVKWDEKEVLINCGDSFERLVGHNDVYENVNDFWREKNASMNRFMTDIGKLAEFKPKKTNAKGEVIETESKMDIESRDGMIYIDDMALVGMPEIYLKIYQGYCMEEKNHSLLNKINEELKKHR